jgi:hypothetical protein
MNAIMGEQLLTLLRTASETDPKVFSEPEAQLFHHAANEIEFYLDGQDVRRFAALMIAKLARKAREGRRGWREASVTDLTIAFREHVAKGDMIDVANFAMMIHYRMEMIGHEPT